MLARKALAGTAGAPKVYVEDVFSTYLYAGGTTTQTITNGIDLSTKGGMVWIKSRASTYNHSIWDSSRAGKYLFVNQADAQTSAAYVNFLTTGFTVTANDGFGYESPYGGPYVSWTFAEQAKFFDVVTYTGNGANRTISHNLGSVPGCIIIKRTDTTGDWQVYHRSLANTEYLVLNTSAAKATGTTRWNSTTPTSTEFSLGTDTTVNANSGTYVAYLFAHDAGGFGDAGDQGVIKCGSYEATGSGAVNIDLGWEPQWVLVKRSVRTGGLEDQFPDSWSIFDNTRGITADGTGQNLRANLTDTESAAGTPSFTATGMSMAGNWNTLSGGSAATFIYIAIRRGPMKTPTSGTSVFQPVAYTGTNVDNRLVDMSLLTDMVFVRQRDDTVLGGMVVGDRLRGNPYLLTGTTAAEVSDADSFMTPTSGVGNAFASMVGFGVGNDATSKLNASTTSNNQIAEGFRRAPGFFDVVCYTGTGTTAEKYHNLGAVPEMVIIKQRNDVRNWNIYHSALTLPNHLQFTTAAAGDESGNLFETPTSTYFKLPNSSETNASGSTYIAYLFASLSGVSKIGTYTGNGSSVTVTTNFQPRFILVKRTDSTGDWIVSDSARGLVAGNDPYLELNTTDAEVTNEDWVDITSTSFTVNQTTNNANVNTGTYIYLAIA